MLGPDMLSLLYIAHSLYCSCYCYFSRIISESESESESESALLAMYVHNIQGIWFRQVVSLMEWTAAICRNLSINNREEIFTPIDRNIYTFGKEKKNIYVCMYICINLCRKNNIYTISAKYTM